MANAIKKKADSNGIYQYVEQINVLDYPLTNWIIDPDVSALVDVPRKYWKTISSGIPLVFSVVEMTQPEKDAVDISTSYITEVSTAPISTIFTRTLTFTDSETKTLVLPKPMNFVTINVYNTAVPILANAQLLSPGGTGWDPFNRSSTEANLIDGNYNNLAYNNTSAGNTSGFILGVDMGSPTLVNAMRLIDWGAAYYCTAWELVGTNDISGSPSGFTVILSETQSAPYLTTAPFLKTFTDVTFRYYGIRVVSSINPNFAIWREMELLTGTMATVEKELSLGADFDYSKINSTTLEINNLKKTSQTYKIVITGN